MTGIERHWIEEEVRRLHDRVLAVNKSQAPFRSMTVSRIYRRIETLQLRLKDIEWTT